MKNSNQILISRIQKKKKKFNSIIVYKMQKPIIWRWQDNWAKTVLL